jgi:hypothetical protein
MIYGYTWDELMMKVASHVPTKYPNSQFAERYHGGFTAKAHPSQFTIRE